VAASLEGLSGAWLRALGLGALLFFFGVLLLPWHGIPVQTATGGSSPHTLDALPATAQGAVSTVLGRADPAYRLHDLTATNPAQRLALRFTSGGVVIGAGRGTMSLRLAAVGRTGAMRVLGQASPRAHANVVSYGRGGLSERYVNGPVGLEQGFTVWARTPGASPLTLQLAFSAGVRVRLDGSGALLEGHGSLLHYSGLEAIDASGRPLRAWLAPVAQGLAIRVDDRGARYPLRIDPFIQEQKLTAPSGTETSFGYFGYDVALSADGNTALIGGYGDNGFVGAAWVFTRSGSTWSQQQKLTASGETGMGDFGSSVALSETGSTALIGGLADNSGVGAAWVFTRSGSSWSQQQKLTATSGSEVGSGQFRSDGALSADGNTALVGGNEDNSGVGAAWVFTRSGSTWSQQQKLTPSGGSEIGSGQFGSSVALAATGSNALIGGNADNNFAGAAWVFTRSGSSWSQQQKLTAASGTESGGGDFGFSAASSADGSTMLIGGQNDDGFLGAAWVFVPGQPLTVSLAGTGAGAVTGSGISCPGGCAHLYPTDAAVSLTATPAAGSAFAGWGGACSGTGACTVMMSGAQAVTATFTRLRPKISKEKISTKHHSALFKFAATGTSGFQCALVKRNKHNKHPKAHFSSCSSPKTYKHLKAGKYTFEVRALSSGSPGPATTKTFAI
jgi:Divergent InlB B-repeat domain/FG-GAP repeat